MKKSLQVGNIIALAVTVALNYFSNTRRIHSTTISEVSGKYDNLFTPEGYAFSIWGLIYLLLSGFVIYQAQVLSAKTKGSDIASLIGPWFIISCIANCAWLLVWLYEYTGVSVIIMIVLLVSLLMIVFRLNLDRNKNESWQRKLFVTIPFSIYAGWITVALIANTAAWLTGIKWQGFGLSESSWAIIMLIAAACINIIVLFRRDLYAYVLTGIWGIIAVGVANEENNSILWTSFIIAGVLLLAGLFRFYTKRKSVANPTR